MSYALATVLYQGSALPCIEVHGRFHPFATLKDGASLPASIATLFEDWARYHPLLARAAASSAPCPPVPIVTNTAWKTARLLSLQRRARA